MKNKITEGKKPLEAVTTGKASMPAPMVVPDISNEALNIFLLLDMIKYPIF